MIAWRSPYEFCFSGRLRHIWWSTWNPGSQNTQWNAEGWAELKQLHCTWFKSRLPHLFLMLEQHTDEISVCVSRSDRLAPRKSDRRSSIEQIYTQLSQIYFCLLFVNESDAPVERDVQIPMCDNFCKLATIQCGWQDFDVGSKGAT